MSLWSVQRRALHAREAHALELPRRAQAAGDGAREERVEALPEPRARGVLGGRDADVVAAVVLDEEVPVAALGERDLAQPALEARALVAELVRGVDRDPADHRDGESEADVFDGAQFAARPQPAGEDQPGVLDRQVQIGAPAVVAVLFEPLDRAVGRVFGVEPDEQVGEREHPEHEHGAVEVERAGACQLDEAPRQERERRHEQAQQPQVALGVAPGRGGELLERARLTRSGNSGHPPCLL